MLIKFLKSIIEKSVLLQKIVATVFPNSVFLNRLSLKRNYLFDYIKSVYPKESIDERLFYNIGAGDQRSKYPIWRYIDLKESSYKKKGIDIFYDLESLTSLPLVDNRAEVVFNSFVIEHISKEATLNLCKEAYRCLKDGGIFHSKIHSYEYAYMLLENGLHSPKIPFNNRESNILLNNFISESKKGVKGYFDIDGNYVVKDIVNPERTLKFTVTDSFVFHNATSAYVKVKNSNIDLQKKLIEIDNIDKFYETIQEDLIENSLKKPHQHNADFLSQEYLCKFLLELGFSKVRILQPFQSMSPVLWEDVLNSSHYGFLFTIEAVK